MKKKLHDFDFCVVGGGMAGLIAAITAARHGTKTALVHDRPVLGGNASSEIRMHICGAHGENMRETGLVEEIFMENHYRNPTSCFSIWDSVLYGKAQYQENLTLFLNTSVNECKMDGDRIASVTGWQFTTETWHTIHARLFADCSGDGILAPLSGALYRVGREGREEFNESIAPVNADSRTMGLTCLMQAREYVSPQKFIAPDWAEKFTKPEDMKGRNVDLRKTNFWWMEVGGDRDSIHDAETLREELVRIAFGVWDYVKNHAPEKEQYRNWGLDWVGFLPGKRESRRYVGDYILTQNDIEAEGRFEDLVCYGGWSMDDHFPAGFYHPEKGTTFHPAPSPYGIPYRSLYSKNIENLYCAGRCHSATHAAMSSTRVMATTSLMGQATGTAAAIAVREGLSPRGVYEKKIEELKDTLMDDDVYLPWHQRKIPGLSKQARLSCSSGDCEAVRNGVDRPVGNESNSVVLKPGESIEYLFDEEVEIRQVRVVFDSDLNRTDEVTPNHVKKRNIRTLYPLNAPDWVVPEALVKAFRIEVLRADGKWERVVLRTDNHQRLVKIPLSAQVTGIRLVPLETWGAPEARIFALEIC
jgi:hypothetical protein